MFIVEYYSALDEILPICDNMDGTQGYYAELNKSDRERQIPYDFIDV